MEEDIKILENIKEYFNLKIKDGYHKIFYNDDMWEEKTVDCINSIDHLISSYKKLEEENKELKETRVTETLKNLSDYDIKIISEECGKALTPIIQNEMKKQIKNDYIPKSVIEELIKEFKTGVINLDTYPNYSEQEVHREIVEVLQELLEKGNK